MYKHAILEETSHFGNQHVTITQYLEKTGWITAFYENKSRMGSGSSLSIQLVITPDKELLEAKITNRGIITNKTAGVSMKFNQLGNLVKDSYPGEYEKMAREYEANFKSFLENLRIKTKSPSPQEAFKHLAANVGKSKAEFSQVASVQHHQPKTSVSIYVPTEIVKKYDLKDGQLAYWKVIGDRLTLKVVKGEHKNVTQFFQKTPSRLDIAIPLKIQTEAGINSGMSFKSEKITDGENRSILLKPDEKSQDIRAYGKDRMNLTISSKSQITGDIEEDTIVNWKIHEKGILLELLGSHPHPVKLWSKGPSIQVTVPKLILKELIGSSTDLHDITPKSLQIEAKIKNLKKAEWTTEGDQIFLRPILESAADNKKIEI